MLFRIAAIQQAAEKQESTCRQLFITQSSRLVQHVSDAYGELQGAITAETQGTNHMPSLRSVDAQVIDTSALPESFSELEDSAFPLFLTFEQVFPLTYTKQLFRLISL